MLFGIIVRWAFRSAHVFETDLSAPANFKHITQRNDWSELLTLDKAECLDHDILYSIENHKITTTQNPFRGFGPRPCSLIRFFPYTASTIKHRERGERERERERERGGKNTTSHDMRKIYWPAIEGEKKTSISFAVTAKREFNKRKS